MAQRNPTAGKADVTPVARSEFNAMLEQREQEGIRTYGTTLQTHNGRDVYQDAKEELIDAWQYVVQAEMEHADLQRQVRELQQQLADLKADHAEFRRALTQGVIECYLPDRGLCVVMAATDWARLLDYTGQEVKRAE